MCGEDGASKALAHTQMHTHTLSLGQNGWGGARGGVREKARIGEVRKGERSASLTGQEQSAILPCRVRQVDAGKFVHPEQEGGRGGEGGGKDEVGDGGSGLEVQGCGGREDGEKEREGVGEKERVGRGEEESEKGEGILARGFRFFWPGQRTSPQPVRAQPPQEQPLQEQPPQEQPPQGQPSQEQPPQVPLSTTQPPSPPPHPPPAFAPEAGVGGSEDEDGLYGVRGRGLVRDELQGVGAEHVYCHAVAPAVSGVCRLERERERGRERESFIRNNVSGVCRLEVLESLAEPEPEPEPEPEREEREREREVLSPHQAPAAVVCVQEGVGTQAGGAEEGWDEGGDEGGKKHANVT